MRLTRWRGYRKTTINWPLICCATAHRSRWAATVRAGHWRLRARYMPAIMADRWRFNSCFTQVRVRIKIRHRTDGFLRALFLRRPTSIISLIITFQTGHCARIGVLPLCWLMTIVGWRRLGLGWLSVIRWWMKASPLVMRCVRRGWPLI